MFNVQSYEEGNLEIYHSDSCGHLDRHRHQLGGYQLYLLKGSPPLAPPKRRGTKKKEDEFHPLSLFVRPV